MFDWIKRLFYGELEKDKVRKWGMDKIKQEEEEAIFKKKCAETPSFSKCVIAIDHKKSQKQKEQLKSYKDAVIKDIKNSINV